jgi:hypothetical protein
MYSTWYCQIVMEHKCSRQVFEKYSNIKFHESPSIQIRVVPCGRTDMTKLILVVFVFFVAILQKRLKIIDLLTLSQFLPKLLPVFKIFGDEFRSPQLPPIPFPIVRNPRPLCNSWHRLCCVLLQSFQVIIQIPWSQLALCCFLASAARFVADAGAFSSN